MKSQTYDVFGLAQIIERGLARKLELIENSIIKLNPNLEPITIVENYAFLVNTNNGDLYRVKYDVSEGVVQFSEPTPFALDTDVSRFDRQNKRIVSEIVDSLSENDEAKVEFNKAKWIANERQRTQLENRLNLNTGIKSESIRNLKKVVTEAVKSTRGARSLIERGRTKSLFGQLLSTGSVDIIESSPTYYDSEKTRQQLVFAKVVETRNAAKALAESPLFSEYAKNIYEGVDVDEAVEFIADEYQEIFTLSMQEQTELFKLTLESVIIDAVDVAEVVECVMAVGNYAINDREIAGYIGQLAEVLDATNGNFHQRMQLIEDEINTRTYTSNDIKILCTVLEGILQHPSEFLAPEFMVEAKRVYRRVSNMVESGNVDDAIISAAIHLVSQFYPQTIGESKKKEGSDYKAFFAKKLEKFGVKSPAELGDKKDDFFSEIESEWDAADEKKGKEETEDDDRDDKDMYQGEAVDPQTGFTKSLMEELSGDDDDETDKKTKKKKKSDDLEGDEPTLESIRNDFQELVYSDDGISVEECDELQESLGRVIVVLEGKEKAEAEELDDEITAKKFTASNGKGKTEISEIVKVDLLNFSVAELKDKYGRGTIIAAIERELKNKNLGYDDRQKMQSKISALKSGQ